MRCFGLEDNYELMKNDGGKFLTSTLANPQYFMKKQCEIKDSELNDFL